MKKETRILAFDDCAFTFSQRRVLVVGVVFRGGNFIDGLLSFSIKKDGNDVTEKLISSVKNSRHCKQISYVMMKGISFGGLNIADIEEIHEKTGKPVIVIQRKISEINSFIDALRKFKGSKKRIAAVKNAGAFHKNKKIFFQFCGCSENEAREVLDLTCTRSNLPEPLRVVHIIASGLSGDSRGRA